MELVTRPEERIRVARLTRIHPEVGWDRLWFSAKESVYKAWYPLRHEWLGFEEVGIELSTNGTFLARIRRADTAPLPRVVSGRWTRGNGVVVTALVLPAERAA